MCFKYRTVAESGFETLTRMVVSLRHTGNAACPHPVEFGGNPTGEASSSNYENTFVLLGHLFRLLANHKINKCSLI